MSNFFNNNPNVVESLLDNLHDGVIIHQSDTQIVYANRAASEILGLSSEQLIGKTAIDPGWFFTDEQRKQLSPREYPVNKLFDSGNSIVNMIIGIQRSLNDFRWVKVNATIISDVSGDRTAMIVFNDVTDQKNSYEEAALFKRVIEAVDTGVTIADMTAEDAPLIYANKAFTDLTGYSFEESIDKNCRYLQNENNKQEGSLIARNAISKGESCNVTLVNYTKNGKLFHNLLTLSPLIENGVVRYYVGVQHDISELKFHEKLLEDQALYIQSILDVQENIVFVSSKQTLLYVNRSFLDFFNVPSLEAFLEENTCISYQFVNDGECFYLGKYRDERFWIEQILTIPFEQRIVKLSSSERGEFYFQVNIKLLKNQHHTVTLHDVTASRIQEATLSNKAYHDPLTGALNRQYFYDYILNNTIFGADTISETGVIMIDLDNFKLVNDTYGHDVGDQVLIEAVKIIATSIRKEDFLIRWGGEEILILSQNQNPKQLQLMAENIRFKIESYPMQTVGRITASLGTAIITGNIEDAIKKADDALYQAKKWVEITCSIIMNKFFNTYVILYTIILYKTT